MTESQRKIGRLGLVATPIGNLGDMTVRAAEWLRQSDLIACEDTRVSGKLLKHFDIRRPMVAYHDHNAEKVRPQILERLKAGDQVALISDAGTPLINDPGYRLTKAAIDAGIEVTVLPGASAVLSALLLSGLPTDRFFYAGFLPPKSAARRRQLRELAAVRATLILFETAPRLAESLVDMAEVLGNRNCAVAREITKMFEETRRGRLTELAQHYATQGPPKGEIVIVIEAPQIASEPAIDVEAMLDQALHEVSFKEAVAKVTAASGLPRREVYARALALKDAGRR